jgi:hypothetical protein
MASWYEGDWTIVYSLDGIRTWQEQVRPLVEALNEVLLPPFPGWFGVDEAGDGEHSSAVWAIGSNVFGVFDYHDAVGAAVMASSTRGLMSTDNG